MTKGTKEWYQIVDMFEKNYKDYDLTKEKEDAPKGYYYTNGEVNKIFNAYLLGYSFGRVNYLNQ